MMLGFLGTIAEFDRAFIAERTRAGLKSAREQGRVGGNPRLKDITDVAARRQISVQRRAAYLDQLRASHGRWLPTVKALRPDAPWEVVVRRLRRVDPAEAWTKPKLVRAIKGLAQIGLADAERLLGRAKPLPPDDTLAKLVASIMRGRPDISIRQIGPSSRHLASARRVAAASGRLLW